MRYKPITIAAPDADLSDVLVRIKLDADTDIGAVCQSNGYDVYFTTSDGSVRLPFSRLEWNVENGTASGQFDVLCDIPVSGVTIRMYYGGITSTDNQSREQTYANYLAVYPLNAITDVGFEDVSGNGKHIKYPDSWDFSIVDNEDYGTMAKLPYYYSQNEIRWADCNFSGTLSVTEIFDARLITGTPGGLAGFTSSAAYAGRLFSSISTNSVQATLSSSSAVNVSVTGCDGYCSYEYPANISESNPFRLRVNSNNATYNGTSDSRLGKFTLFPTHSNQGGIRPNAT